MGAYMRCGSAAHTRFSWLALTSCFMLISRSTTRNSFCAHNTKRMSARVYVYERRGGQEVVRPAACRTAGVKWLCTSTGSGSESGSGSGTRGQSRKKGWRCAPIRARARGRYAAWRRAEWGRSAAAWPTPSLRAQHMRMHRWHAYFTVYEQKFTLHEYPQRTHGTATRTGRSKWQWSTT